MKYLLIMIASTTFCGCITNKEVIYVPESEKVVKLKYDNKDGYFVPKSTMKKLLEYKVERDYYLNKYGPISY